MSEQLETRAIEAQGGVAAQPRRRRRAARRGRRALQALLPVITALILLSIWELVSRTETVDPIVLPPPTEVAAAFGRIVQEEFFWQALRVTVWEALAGLAIGASAGLVLGTLIGLIDLVRRALYPLVVAFQTMPQVAIAPLFLVWFGFGLTPRVMFAATTCFFPVLVGAIVGLSTADKDAELLLRSFGASRWQTYRKLLLPASLPVVFAGLRTAVTLCLIGAIVGEFVGGNEGLGVLINTFNFQLNIAESFAVVLVLAIIGLTLYGLVELADRKVVYWRHRRDS